MKMKAALIVTGLFLAMTSLVFAERLDCQDQYEEAYNASMDAMENPQKASKAEEAQNNFYTCLDHYESRHGKQARGDLSVKLEKMQP